MSLFTRVIGQQPPTDREIRIGCPQLEQPSVGWDTLRELLWLPHDFWLRRGQERDGPGPEGGRFIIQDLKTVDYKAGRPIVEVTSLGIATQDGKDYKVSCNAGVSEDLSLMVPITYTVWRKRYPVVTKLWVSLVPVNIYDHVNVPSLPPDTFGIGGAAWSYAYVSASSWVANGWIGSDRAVDKLPGSSASLITDSWIYDPGEDRDGSNFFTAFN